MEALLLLFAAFSLICWVFFAEGIPLDPVISNYNGWRPIDASNQGAARQQTPESAVGVQPRIKDKANRNQAQKPEYEIREEDIISLPIGRFVEPQCEYHVLSAPFGRPISSANLGDPVYHQWTCKSSSGALPNQSMYCLQVVNCTATDQSNRKAVAIVNENGCSLDKTGTVSNVEYHNDLEGGIQTTAFALDIDSGAVHFNCGLKLFIKDSKTSGCQRSVCT